MSDINNGDGSAPLDIMELDDIPDDVLLWDLSPATELPAANGSVAPAQYAAPAAPAIAQPTAAPPFVFRPQAEIFRPQPQRPQLQLATSEVHLQPNNPAYNFPAPRSAPTPDIRVDSPDAFLRVHHPASAVHAHGNSRRRAVSHTPALHHHETAPELAPHSDGLLSPLGQWMRSEDSYPVGYGLRGAPATSSPKSPERSRRGSRSPSRSRSHSRSSSAASSVRSSVNGEYRCAHEGCGRPFSTAAKLNHHKRYHTPTHSRPFACDRPQCNARFLFKRELLRHKQSKTHQAPQCACPVCGQLFPRQDHVDRHLSHNSCTRRPATPATPASSSMPHSAPSTTGSSVEHHMQPYGSADHFRFDTPFTQPETPSHLDSGAFSALPIRMSGAAAYDCDVSMVLPHNEQWPPSHSPSNWPYGNNPFFPGSQQQ